MKKYLFTLLTLVFVCPFFSLAQKVKKEDASELAKIIFKKHNSGRLTNTKGIIPLGNIRKTEQEKVDTLLYIVPFEKGGFAIISGDKGAPPYLGYCPKGDFREADLPPGLDYLLEKYKSKISKIKNDRNPQDEDIKKQWEEIYDQNQLRSVTSNVAPMLDTEWGQRYGFNDSVPNNYPAGCTAVAMAQILRYWECRVNPTGNLTWVWNGLVSHANFGATTYSWLDMDNQIRDELNAQLIYHAGVSCLTKYKSNGSSSTPGRAKDGFVNYWGMDNDADVKWRIWHLSNWKGMLVDELHAGSPILYSAGGAEIGGDLLYGHSWVIDGVTIDHNYFWCNWGWYGDYNGWYELGNFKPKDNNYNQMESAIFNVYPTQPSGIATPQLANQSFTYNSNG
ncbi:MAG: C10 family peptidase [Candidatus Cloacimonetes bacterium]|nr:C10 family peptidase [Candidatus Cloacimonadota bacterium]